MSKLVKILCALSFLSFSAANVMAQSPSGSGSSPGSPNDTTNSPTASGSRSGQTMDQRPTDPNQKNNNKPLEKRLEGDNRMGNDSKGN